MLKRERSVDNIKVSPNIKRNRKSEHGKVVTIKDEDDELPVKKSIKRHQYQDVITIDDD
jgi:hypothetical protein